MSTSGEFFVSQANWLGYPQAALPNGVWFSTGSVLGDGSAGFTTVNHVFKQAGAPPNNQLYSLESCQVAASEGIGETVAIQGAGFTQTFGFSFQTGALTVINPAAPSTFNIETVRAFRGTFLGELTRATAVAAQINVRIANPGVGPFLQSALVGYFWGPEAKSAPGGPQRPPTGLFAT